MWINYDLFKLLLKNNVYMHMHMHSCKWHLKKWNLLRVSFIVIKVLFKFAFEKYYCMFHACFRFDKRIRKLQIWSWKFQMCGVFSFRQFQVKFSLCFWHTKHMLLHSQSHIKGLFRSPLSKKKKKKGLFRSKQSN